MRIEDGSQGTFLAVNRESACDLGEDTNIVDVLGVPDHILILVLVLEQECTNVWLTTLNRLSDCIRHLGVLNGNSLVEAREEWSSSNRDR